MLEGVMLAIIGVPHQRKARLHWYADRGAVIEAAGKLPVHRHPLNNYRLFKVSDLDKLLRMTEQSAAKRNRKPR